MEIKILRHINPHIDDVNRLLSKMAMNPKYNYGSFSQDSPLVMTIEEDTWRRVSFVIIEYSRVVGVITGYFSRPVNNIRSVWVQAEAVNPTTVPNAIKEFMYIMFNVYGVGKICWSVATKNRAMKLYDRYQKLYPEIRVVGTFYNDDVARNGEIVDVKHYELLKEDYFNNIIK